MNAMIEFNCPQCGAVLRVGDEKGGKKARCPKCSAICRIPSPTVDAPTAVPVIPVASVKAQPVQAETFYVDSVSGQTFGPVPFENLHDWVAQQRVTADCLIRPATGGQGVPASLYFPELAGAAAFGATPTTPQFAPLGQGQPRYQQSKQTTGQPIRPTTVRVGDVLDKTGKLYWPHVWNLVFATIFLGVVNGIFNGVSNALDTMGGNEVAAFLVSLIGFPINIFFQIGYIKMLLDICDGRQSNLNTLFTGGDRFLPVLGFTFGLWFLPAFVFGFVIVLVAAPDVALIAGAIFWLFYIAVTLLTWPIFYVLIEGRTTFGESIRTGFQMASLNIGQTILLGIVSFGIVLLGVCALCLGVFWAVPYVSLMWTIAYRMMSGSRVAA